MTNQEISNLFNSKVPANKPKDLYDRYMDVAIYINDTTAIGEDNTQVINDLADSLTLAYELERI